MSKGAEELRKFYDRKRINRIVLLSDGQANVGPSTSELGQLGASLGQEGIAVTTIGLGLDYRPAHRGPAGRPDGQEPLAAARGATADPG